MIAFLSSYPIAALYLCHPEFKFMCRRHTSQGEALLHFSCAARCASFIGFHTPQVYFTREAHFTDPVRDLFHCLLSTQKTAHLPSRQMSCFLLAPQVGLEPTTTRLTAECSAIELLRNTDCWSNIRHSNSPCTFVLWNPAMSYSPGPLPAKYHQR